MDDDDKKKLESPIMGMIKQCMGFVDANNDGKISFDEACRFFFSRIIAMDGGEPENYKLPADPDEAKQTVIKKLDAMTMKMFWEQVEDLRGGAKAHTGKLVF